MVMDVYPETSGSGLLLEPTSMRGELFAQFSQVVLTHVDNYTVPQYGDYPNDPVTNFSVEDLKCQLSRYVNRIGSNARGLEEALRDTYKIAHYASLLKLAYEDQVDE